MSGPEVSSPPAISPARRDGLWLLIATLVAAFNLRLGIASPGPVIETIRADTGMSSGLAGLLITIPFVCMSGFAFAGPSLLRRTSSYGVILLALSLIAAGTLARAGAPTPLLLIAATIPIGMGIAFAGGALPVLVEQNFRRHSGAVTGLYVSSFSVGVALIATTIEPLADLLGSWRAAFAISAIPALVAIVIWVAISHARRVPGEPLPAAIAPLGPGPAVSNLRPGRVELLAAASFGLQSMCYAGLVGWIAALYVETGWSTRHRGADHRLAGPLRDPGVADLPEPLAGPRSAAVDRGHDDRDGRRRARDRARARRRPADLAAGLRDRRRRERSRSSWRCRSISAGTPKASPGSPPGCSASAISSRRRRRSWSGCCATSPADSRSR